MTQEDHHRVSSLVTDLVEMANATRRLPEVEAELREAYRKIDGYVSRIESLERKIQDEVQTNNALAERLHAAEVARDDAGFRQLDAEDRVNALRDAITTSFSHLGGALGVVNGDGRQHVTLMTGLEATEYQAYKLERIMKAEEAMREANKMILPPEAAPGAYTPPPVGEVQLTGLASSTPEGSGESAADPSHASQGPVSSTQLDTSAVGSATQQDTASSAEGVSVSSDPIPFDATLPDGSSSANVSTGDAAKAESAQASPLPEGKYYGKEYRSWPGYVSEASWIAGGGTSESYWIGRENL